MPCGISQETHTTDKNYSLAGRLLFSFQRTFDKKLPANIQAEKYYNASSPPCQAKYSKISIFFAA